ncbi:helix-turn-helix domain-containing protein [Thalassorhabdus alkalitolerans]|uniref:Helix-turn-helix domain-containing protein n=1 Tax=Thalassorhabdus alkalitolerans TaxID=2282697 RepID=A0ABW0YSF0_9BACI
MEETRLEAMWGSAILDEGFTCVPNMIIRNATKVGLTGKEFQLVLTIMSFKHDTSDPFPSQETLATIMGTTKRNIRKLLKSIEEKQLVLVGFRMNEKGQRQSNVYNFKPLVDQCLKIVGEKQLPERQIDHRIYWKHTSAQHPSEQNVPVDKTQKVPVGEEQNVPPKKKREKENKKKKKENLSITNEKILAMNLPEPITTVLLKYKNRLIDDVVEVVDIENHFKSKDNMNPHFYALCLKHVLQTTKDNIRRIGYLIDLALTQQKGPKSYMTQKQQTIKKDKLPKWLQKEQQRKDTTNPNRYPSKDEKRDSEESRKLLTKEYHFMLSARDLAKEKRISFEEAKEVLSQRKKDTANQLKRSNSLSLAGY